MSAAVGIGGRYASVEKIVRSFVIRSLAESFLLAFVAAFWVLLLLLLLFALLLEVFELFLEDGFLMIEISLPRLPRACAC